ncbi:NADPH-dependent FMN reductase [Leucobacter sp. GX24907]
MSQLSKPRPEPASHPGSAPPRPGLGRKIRIALVISSVREGRMGDPISRWVGKVLAGSDEYEVFEVDLADVTLPDDRYLIPGGAAEHIPEQANLIDSSDAFVFVTPEYNRSFPGTLKRFIDWHYREWMFKPATVVSYGAHGGHTVVENLRAVLAELNVVTTKHTVSIASPWEKLGASNQFEPGDRELRRLIESLNELLWWAQLLAAARVERPFTT